MSKKALGGDKSVTVADYSWQFFERVLQGKYGDSPEENSRKACENFFSLITKLQDTGSKDDVKVPLRVLRDQIGKVYFASGNKQQQEQIELLFKLYDGVEERLQQQSRDADSMNARDAGNASALLEELRLRFYRLAVGDTWEQYPDLKLKALKRMQLYANKEQQRSTSSRPAGWAAGPSKKKWGRSASTVGGVHSNWQSTIDQLATMPATKLFPFVRVLLAESVSGAAMQGTPTAETPSAPSSGAATPTAAAAESPAASPVKPPLQPAPSSMSQEMDKGSGLQTSGSKLAALNLDDLLGLDDPSPAQTPQAARSSAAGDPFTRQLNGSASHQQPQQPQQPSGMTSPFSQAPTSFQPTQQQAMQQPHQYGHLPSGGSQSYPPPQGYHPPQQQAPGQGVHPPPQQQQQQYQMPPHAQQFQPQLYQPPQQANQPQQPQQQQYHAAPQQLQSQQQQGGYAHAGQTQTQPLTTRDSQGLPSLPAVSSSNPFGSPAFTPGALGSNRLSQESPGRPALQTAYSGAAASPHASTLNPKDFLPSPGHQPSQAAPYAAHLPPSPQAAAHMQGPHSSWGQPSPSAAAPQTQQSGSWTPDFYAPSKSTQQASFGGQPQTGNGFEATTFGGGSAFAPGASLQGASFDAFGLQPGSQTNGHAPGSQASQQAVPSPMRAAPSAPGRQQSGSQHLSAW